MLETISNTDKISMRAAPHANNSLAYFSKYVKNYPLSFWRWFHGLRPMPRDAGAFLGPGKARKVGILREKTTARSEEKKCNLPLVYICKYLQLNKICVPSQFLRQLGSSLEVCWR